jgi:succinyl-CoA synthetase beta subunit
VKSQIHAGGRGAGRFKDDPNGKGGVRVVKSIARGQGQRRGDARQVLVTKQTGPKGKEVKRVYIEEGATSARALSRHADRPRQRPHHASRLDRRRHGRSRRSRRKHPEKIIKVAVDPATGHQAVQARKIAFGLGLVGNQVRPAPSSSPRC